MNSFVDRGTGLAFSGGTVYKVDDDLGRELLQRRDERKIPFFRLPVAKADPAAKKAVDDGPAAPRRAMVARPQAKDGVVTLPPEMRSPAFKKGKGARAIEQASDLDAGSAQAAQVPPGAPADEDDGGVTV